VKLTQATIATIELRPDQSERIVFDERLPGFGLRLRAVGKRTWIVQYRIARKQRRMTLGSVEMMMAGQAYAAAEHVLSQVKRCCQSSASTCCATVRPKISQERVPA
jgi:hypothetical protein